MAKIYSAADIIGNNLVAKNPVKIYRRASDNAAPVYTVAVGNSVGIVYSYLQPNANRKGLWWVFLDQNKKQYYTPHSESNFDLNSLNSQGIETIDDQTRRAKEAAEIAAKGKFVYYFERYGKVALWAAVGLFIAGKIIDKKL